MKTYNNAQYSSAYARFILVILVTLLTTYRASAFKILIDVNQISSSEASSINSNGYFSTADGAWVEDGNSNFSDSSEWITLISNLNGSDWVVTEDLFTAETTTPIATSCYSDVSSSYGFTVNQAMVYIEETADPALASEADTILHYDSDNSFDQIAAAYSQVNETPIVVNSRAYTDTDGFERYTYTNDAIANSEVGGVSFEFNPTSYETPGDPSSGMFSGDAVVQYNFAQGAEAAISAGKKCYLLLAPQVGSTDYAEDVLDTLTYLASYCNDNGITDPANTSQSLLHSSSLFVVLAAYVESSTNVGFITGLDSTGYENSVLDAFAGATTFREFGTY